MKVNYVEITEATIQQTREWFAENARQCIADAKSGKQFVNDLNGYVKWKEAYVSKIMEGGSDHTFAFMQRAHYLQTGESVALLP